MYIVIFTTHEVHAVRQTVVLDRHNYFREGNTSITDKKGRGRREKVTMTLVANTLENDRPDGKI